MSVSSLFNESFYLTNNADVVVGISQGHFSSALQHYTLFGGKELRAPNSTFDANYYAINNADVLNAVSSGVFGSVFAHFQEFGESENRAPTSAFATFDAAAYLAANTDVATAVTAGTFSSALDHFISFGQSESREGSGITVAINPGTTFTLTTTGEALVGTANDDIFIGGVSATAADNTLSLIDTIDGGAGADTLKVSANVLATNIAIPATGISNIETVRITAVDGDGTVGTDAATFASRTGVTKVEATGNSNVTVTGLATGAVIEMVGDGSTINGILSYAYGTATAAQTINVSGGTLSSGVADITATASAGVTTATINSTGAANKVDTIKLDSAGGNTVTSLTINATTGLTGVLTAGDYATTTALTVTGAGAVNIGANGDFKTVDASTNSGGLTMTADTVTTSLVGSTGNDVITSAATTSTTAGIIDGGDGTDTLIIANNNQVDTAAEGAEYTNFETLRMAGTLDVSHVGSAMTALQLTGTSTLTNVTAALAADVTFRADAGATGIALASASGTSDVLNLKMGTGAADASEATDLTGTLTVNGFETINIQTNQGTTAGTAALKTSTFTALTADSVTAINLTGAAVTITDASTTKATTIDGSALTGILTIGGDLIAASTVTGGAGKDVLTVGANNGSTYNGGANDDTFSATAAQLAATGTADTVIDGGAGTKDKLTITGTPTVTDNHFTNVSNAEQLQTSNTASTSVTAGGSFKAAFSDGVTITTGALVDTATYTFAGGLYDKDTTITVNGGLLVGNAAGEDVTVTTGAGSDTVTIQTDDTFVGQAADSGTIAVVSNGGDDTIVFDYGNMAAVTNSQVATIDAGTGADTITKGTNADNSTTALAATIYTINAGDSLTTAAGHDTITGFEFADGINQSDVLQFDGTASAGTLATSTDAGTILSHSIGAAAIATFDDAATFATALVISDSNLTDVLSYLDTNSNNNGVIAFLFDSTGNGANDATMIYHNAAGSAVNSLVQLSAVTTLDAVVFAQGTGNLDLVAL
jgi:hypothetical protein